MTEQVAKLRAELAATIRARKAAEEALLLAERSLQQLSLREKQLRRAVRDEEKRRKPVASPKAASRSRTLGGPAIDQVPESVDHILHRLEGALSSDRKSWNAPKSTSTSTSTSKSKSKAEHPAGATEKKLVTQPCPICTSVASVLKDGTMFGHVTPAGTPCRFAGQVRPSTYSSESFDRDRGPRPFNGGSPGLGRKR